MKQVLSSPWFAVSLGIVGLVAGYSFVVSQNSQAFAAVECLADTPQYHVQ